VRLSSVGIKSSIATATHGCESWTLKKDDEKRQRIRNEMSATDFERTMDCQKTIE